MNQTLPSGPAGHHRGSAFSGMPLENSVTVPTGAATAGAVAINLAFGIAVVALKVAIYH